MCKMCVFPYLLLPEQFLIIGLFTRPPVILTPTAAGSIVHFLLSVCVWSYVAGLFPQYVCLASTEGASWVLPMTLLSVSASYVFVSLSI